MERGTFIGRVGSWLRGSRRAAAQSATSIAGVAHGVGRGGVHEASRPSTDANPAGFTPLPISEVTEHHVPPAATTPASRASESPRFDDQTRWLERSSKTLDECRELLSCVVEDTRDRELLQHVSEQLEDARATFAQAVDALGALPGIADNQRELLVCLRRQFESTQATRQDEIAALSEIKDGIAATREATLQVSEKMQAFYETQQGREERWAAFVNERATPFLRMGWSLVVLTAVSLVLSLIALWR